MVKLEVFSLSKSRVVHSEQGMSRFSNELFECVVFFTKLGTKF